MKLIKLVLLLSFVLFSVCNAKDSTFTKLTLARGIEIQLPSSWRIFGKDENQLISTVSDAFLESLGYIPAIDGRKLLLRVTSMPAYTYASISIHSHIPVMMTVEEANHLNYQQINFMVDYWDTVIAKSSNQLVKTFPGKKVKCFGYPCLLHQYIRTGQKGNVFVERIFIFTSRQTIEMTLSHRISEKQLWGPIIQKAFNSLNIL